MENEKPVKAGAGVIEIITDAAEIMRIEAERRGLLAASNLPPAAARTGRVFEDEYIVVVRDPVRFPSGETGTYLRIIERAALDGAAGVVMLPLLDGRVVLREVFRHATRRWELECPRGFRPAGSTPEEAARREIAEELGLKIRDEAGIVRLGEVCGNTGLLAGAAEAFVVYLEAGTPAPQPEAQESFGAIHVLSPAELLDRLRAGEVRDGFTLSALQLAEAHGLFSLFAPATNP